MVYDTPEKQFLAIMHTLQIANDNKLPPAAVLMTGIVMGKAAVPHATTEQLKENVLKVVDAALELYVELQEQGLFLQRKYGDLCPSKPK